MKETLKIILVDNDNESRMHLRKIINGFGSDFIVVGEAKDALCALKLIKNQQPEIIITEIELLGGNCFDILDCISNKDIAVIMATSINDYAITAFKYNVVDYLLKPLDSDKLLLALIKAKEKCIREFPASYKYSKHLNGMSLDDPIKLSIHSQNEIEFIEIESIIRMEAEGCYTNVFLVNGRKITVSKSLGEFESILLNEKFARVHNSHIVNLKHIIKFLKKDGLILLMHDGYMVPIAVRRKEIFEKKMKLMVI